MPPPPRRVPIHNTGGRGPQTGIVSGINPQLCRNVISPPTLAAGWGLRLGLPFAPWTSPGGSPSPTTTSARHQIEFSFGTLTVIKTFLPGVGGSGSRRSDSTGQICSLTSLWATSYTYARSAYLLVLKNRRTLEFEGDKDECSCFTGRPRGKEG